MTPEKRQTIKRLQASIAKHEEDFERYSQLFDLDRELNEMVRAQPDRYCCLQAAYPDWLKAQEQEERPRLISKDSKLAESAKARLIEWGLAPERVVDVMPFLAVSGSQLRHHLRRLDDAKKNVEMYRGYLREEMAA